MTHRFAEGHEGVPRGKVPATLDLVQAPLAGSVVVNTSPALSVATHRATDGQSTPLNTLVPVSRVVGAAHEKGAAGAIPGTVVVVAGQFAASRGHCAGALAADGRRARRRSARLGRSVVETGGAVGDGPTPGPVDVVGCVARARPVGDPRRWAGAPGPG